MNHFPLVTMRGMLAVVAAAILSTFTTRAQRTESPDGFLGIPWGTSREEATRKMLERKGVQEYRRNTDSSFAIFNGGTFAEYKVTSYTLEFDEDGLYSAHAYLEFRNQLEPYIEYSELVRLITEKYGRAGKDSIYSLTEKPLPHDKTFAATTWRFQTGGKPEDSIMVVLKPWGTIITYNNGQRASKALARRKARQLKDL